MDRYLCSWCHTLNLLINKRPPLPSDIDDDETEDKHQSLLFPAAVSDNMKTLVLKLMKTNRKLRPQSVDEVLPSLDSKPDKTEKPAKEPVESKEELEDSEVTIIASPISEDTIIEKKPQPEVKPEQKEYIQEVVYTTSTSDDSNSNLWKIIVTFQVEATY